MLLTLLSTEVLDNIVQYLPVTALKDLRLTSRLLSSVSTSYLFSTVFYKPGLELKRRRTLLASSDLERLVHHMVIEASNLFHEDLRGLCNTDGHQGSEICFKKWLRQLWDERLTCLKWQDPARGPLAILRDLPRYWPNAESLEFRFPLESPDLCRKLEGRSPRLRAPKLYYRKTHLRALLKALALRARSNGSTTSGAMQASGFATEIPRPIQTVRNLTITDITGWPRRDSTLQDDLNHCIGALRELHLLLGANMYPRFLKENDFVGRLRFEWLQPTAMNLTSLSLYFDEHWGCFPYFKYDGFILESLRTLALGKYVFAYPRQIEWICCQQGLEKLVLDNCPIVCRIIFGRELWEDPRPDLANWTRYYPPDHRRGTRWFDNLDRWDQNFEMIGERLPKLKDFRVGSGPWMSRRSSQNFWERLSQVRFSPPTSAFEARWELCTQLMAERCILYNSAKEFRRWVELEAAEENQSSEYGFDSASSIRGDFELPLSEETRARDRAALSKLLAKLRARVYKG